MHGCVGEATLAFFFREKKDDILVLSFRIPITHEKEENGEIIVGCGQNGVL